MATVVGVTAIKVKTTVKKKKKRKAGRTVHLDAHFPVTAPLVILLNGFFGFTMQEQLLYTCKDRNRLI